MALIAIETFGGEIPRTTPRLLEQTQATIAINCDLGRGHLEPLNGPLRVATIPSGTKTIFKHDVKGWMTWNKDVNVVKSAVLDVDGEAPLGHIFVTGDKSYPTQYFANGVTKRLGIPRPGIAPTVKLTLGAGKSTTRAYAWGAVNLTGAPARYGFEAALKELEDDTSDVSVLSEPTINEDGTVNIERSSTYCYTLVQSLANGIWQQESAPSPASEVVDVIDGAGVTISGFVVPNITDLTISAIRIYRSATGSSGSSEFQFVAEIPVSQKSYLDAALDAELSGELLETTTWDCIPDDAIGMIKTDNGIYAAFRGNEVLLSEPFIPYAFPESYRNTVEDTIVALGHTDNTIIVLTKGRPYLITGSEPESMIYTHLPIEQSCVSARSVASLPGGVMYASPDGLMLFTSNDQNVVSSQTWTRDQWQALNPSSIIATYHDDQYLAFFEGTNKGFIFSIGSKEIVEIEFTTGWKVRDVYHHSEDDCVYIAIETNAGTYIYQHDAGEPLPYTWRSKPFFTSVMTCMSALRIESDFSSNVKVSVYGPNAKARQVLTVTNSRTKRLTTTRSEKEWGVMVEGTATIFGIRMGNTVQEVEYGNNG